MPAVSSYPSVLGATRSASVQHPHRVAFGEGPRTVIIEHKIKTPASESPDRSRRLFAPIAWIVAGTLLTVGTAGILHFIGLPMIAWGAYKAYKRW